jgi:hypothetical protein
MSNGDIVTSSQGLREPAEAGRKLSGRGAGRLCGLLLAVVLVVAAILRFHEIDRRGPAFFDEGIYHREGLWIYTAASSLKEAFERKLAEARSGRNLYTFQEEAKRIAERIEGEPPVWGRPAFSLLTGLSMACIGPRVYAAHAVSAFFGTLSVLALFFLARSVFPRRVALLASLLLALSGYHYVYSVAGLADVSAMFFTLVSFLFYSMSRREDRIDLHAGWIALTGALSGLAFTAHDRFLYAFFVILFCEAADFFLRQGSRSTVLRRGLLLCCTFMIPLFLFELPYYLGMVFLRRFQQALPFRTYFEELFTHHIFNFLDAFAFTMVDLSRIPEAREAGSRLYNFFTYPYLYFLFDGPVFLLLFLVGLLAAIRTRSRADTLLLAWFWVPFVLCSMGLAASVRYGLVFLPAAMLLAARSIPLLSEWAARLPGIRRVPAGALAALLLVAVAASNAAVTAELRGLRCSYEAPAGFLAEHGPRHISLQYPVSQAYFGADSVKEPPRSREELEEAYREGFRYYLVDFRKWFLRGRPGLTEQADVVEEIERRLSPIFTYVHPCYSAACYIFEANIFFKATLRLVREAHERGLDEIRIYDLQPLFDSEEG